MLNRLWPAGLTGGGSGGGSSAGFFRAARIVLAPPDFQVNPSVLIDSYLEWPVRLLGSLSGVRSNRDISNRAYLLSLVDSIERGVRGSRAPPVDALLSLSVSGVRLERRPPPTPPQQQQQLQQPSQPDVLLRVPVSQLLAVAYVRDSDRHLLALHFSPDAAGTSQLCAMAVYARIHAQEACAVARQLLQLAYTEATLEFFDRALGGAASTTSGAPSASGASILGVPGAGSGESNATPVTSTTSSPVFNRRDSPQEAVSSLAGSLASSLTKQELVLFGQLFRSWSSGASSFSGSVRPQLERLFPAERSHLLLGLRPFIPARDQAAFDDFLHDRGLRPSGYSRSVSIGSTASSVRSRDSSEIDMDQALGSIVAQVQRLDMSQQQFAQPSYSRSVSSVAASSVVGRSVGPSGRYLGLDGTGLDDPAFMVAPMDTGRIPANEFSPMGHAHRF